MFVNCDVREGREAEKWINVVGQKKRPFVLIDFFWLSYHNKNNILRSGIRCDKENGFLSENSCYFLADIRRERI